MFLDERSANLLKLLQQTSNIKMSELESKTGLTRRQLQYDIGKVNDWLHSHGYQPVDFNRNIGYFCQEKF